MKRFRKFLIFFVPATVLRFALGTHSFSFVWFLVLYFPSVNWVVYWLMGLARLLINRMHGREKVTVAAIRRVFSWYILLPGALVAADIVYRGYLYNAGGQ